MPIEITLTAREGSPVQILSTPTIVATPETVPNVNGDWKTVTGDAAPAVITDTAPYNAVTRGQVMSEDQCFPPEVAIPATDVPNGDDQQPLTSLAFTFTYVCVGDNVDETPQTVTAELISLSS